MDKFELLEELYVKYNDKMHEEVMALEGMRIKALQFESTLAANSQNVSASDKAKLIQMTKEIMAQYEGLKPLLKSTVDNGKNAKMIIDVFEDAYAYSKKAKQQKDAHA